MKIIAIGDTHGRSIWKDIVADNKDADKIVFIGDYWDSFHIPFEEQMKNFKEIIAFKKKNMDKVILIKGNHDHHYLSEDEFYSGYQHAHSDEIKDILKKNKKLLQVGYYENGYLFSHAGITKTWLMDSARLGIFDNMDLLPDEINLMCNIYPNILDFKPSNPLDNTGDSITQSPIWVRPRALLSDDLGIKQVVGHTPQTSVNTIKNITFIDTLNTEKSYLVITDNSKRVEWLKR